MTKEKKRDPLSPFDATDRELIALLKRDARAPISVLAEVLKLSRGTVQNRLDKLFASGALLGFSVRVRDDFDPNSVRAVMMIEVAGKSTSQVILRLRRIPELEKIHTTNGGWDLVAEICASNLQEFDRVLRDVREIEGVLNSETSILLSTV